MGGELLSERELLFEEGAVVDRAVVGDGCTRCRLRLLKQRRKGA